MSLPEPEEVERLAIGELRSLVESLLAEMAQLRAENAALREEVARLKGLPLRPKLKPSGMEKAGQLPTPQSSGKPKRKRRRGAKRDRLVVGEERVLAVLAPAGSRFKGYEDIIVQDLLLVPRVIRYRRERWLTPDGRTIIAPLPAGIVGGFGPALRRFVLAGHVQGQVTSERLTALLEGIGIAISKRQVVRLLTGRLDTFVAEDREVLRAGLASAPWVSVDDTGARHAGRNGVTTQIGDGRFTAFRTSLSKSRTNFLDCLRAGHDDYVVDEAAVAYMRRHHLAGSVIDRLISHPQRSFPNQQAWAAHLEALGIAALEVLPDPVKIATQGAMWGAIHQHGLLRDTVVVSDARQRCCRGPVPRRHPRPMLGSCRTPDPQAAAGHRDAASCGRSRPAADLVALPRPEGLAGPARAATGGGNAHAVRPDLQAPYRLCDARSSPRPAPRAQDRAPARARPAGDPAAYRADA